MPVTKWPVAKFTIPRSKWIRGMPGFSSLLVPDGKMCCLGHYGKACGVPDESMLNRPLLSRVSMDSQLYWLDPLDLPRPEFKLLVANDEPRGRRYSDADREADITRIFADHGITVTFTD